MIKAFILSYQMVGGFGFVPMSTAEECDKAMAGLAPAITWDAECSEIEIFAHSSPLAPEVAPMPPPKPERPA